MVPGSERDIPGVGDEVEITIESVAFGGDGVARYGNYVLFVPDVLPQETVAVRITEVKRSYGRGMPAAIRVASPHRVEPVCDVYGLCGGCQYQHMAYGKSLELKEQQVREVMLRIGGLAIEDSCGPMLPAPDAYGYRNAVSLHVRESGGYPRVGYFARDNRTFVPVSRCPIASKEINESLAGIEATLHGFDRPESIRGVTIKSAGARTLACPVYHKPLRFKSDERLCYRYRHIDFSYGAGSFFQVNHAMIPGLMGLVSEALGPQPGEMLLDLYAGVGLFSLALADRYRRVVGIEAGEEAAGCFETNIIENTIRNVTVQRGKVERNLETVRREVQGETVSVLVDPPREGLNRRVVGFLKSARIRKLVYVSCDPATLARDLKELSKAYTIQKITPLDMFPQTRHIETVTALESVGDRRHPVRIPG